MGHYLFWDSIRFSLIQLIKPRELVAPVQQNDCYNICFKTELWRVIDSSVIYWDDNHGEWCESIVNPDFFLCVGSNQQHSDATSGLRLYYVCACLYVYITMYMNMYAHGSLYFYVYINIPTLSKMTSTTASQQTLASGKLLTFLTKSFNQSHLATWSVRKWPDQVKGDTSDATLDTSSN